MSDHPIHLCIHFHCDPIFTAPQAVHIGECVDLASDYVAQCQRDSNIKVVLSEMDYLCGFWQVYADQRPLFREMVLKGRVETSGSYSEPNENSIGGEGLARNIIYGQWFLVERLGAKGDVYMPFDVFGHTSQLPQLLKKAGFTGAIWTKGSPKGQGGDELSRWMAPDGSTILSQVSSYGAVDWGAKDQRDGLLKLLDGRTGGKDPQKVRPQIVFRGADFVSPPFFLEGFSETLKEHGTKISLPSDFFADASQWEKSGSRLPLTVREQSLYHAGTALSRSELKIANRATESRLAAAESLGVVAALLGIPYQDAHIDSGWRQTLFCQHHDSITGTSNDQSYLDLMGHARLALSHASQALSHSTSGICSLINTSSLPEGTPVVVFNPTARSRTDVVAVNLSEQDQQADSDSNRRGIADSNGNPVPSERVETPSGPVLSFIANVSGLGVATYLILEDADQPAESPVVEQGKSISNAWVSITVDPARGGGITSLIHCQSEREFARKESAHLLNVLMCLKEGPGPEPSWEMHTTGPQVFSDESPAEVWITRSSVAVRMHIRGNMPDMEGYEQTITLWDGIERIDCETVLVGYSGSRLIGKDRATMAWGGSGELDDNTPEERDLFGVIFPTSLSGAVPVYSDRYGHRTLRRGEGQFDYRTSQKNMFSGCAVHSADQWADLSWDVRIDVSDGNRIHGNLSLGMVRLIRPEDGQSRDGADELLWALGQRGITTTPYGDRENQDRDHLQTTHVVAVGSLEDNLWIKNWWDTHPEVAETLSPVLKKDGSVTALAEVALWPDSEPNRKVPLLLVIGASALRAQAAAERLADDVRTGRIAVKASQCFVDVSHGDDAGFGIINTGTVATSTEADGTLTMLLQHSAGWCDWATPNYLGVPFVPERKSSVYRYSMVPHEGDWRIAAMPVTADDLNRPLIARITDRHTGELPLSMGWCNSYPSQVLITACYPLDQPTAKNRSHVTDISKGITLRGYEWAGVPTHTVVTWTTGLKSALLTDLVGRGGIPLAVSKNGVHLPLVPNAVETFLIKPEAFTADDSFAPIEMPTEKIFCRWWLQNGGAAPIGNMPVSVALRGELLAGTCSKIELVVANNLTDVDAEITVSLDAPEGWAVAEKISVISLSPDEGRLTELNVTVPKEGKGCLVVTILHNGLSYTDALWLEPVQFPLVTSVECDNDEIVVAISNSLNQSLDVELTLISPLETWSELELSSSRFGQSHKSISIAAKKTKSERFEVSVMAQDQWAWIKIAVFGQCKYERVPIPRTRKVTAEAGTSVVLSFSDIDISIDAKTSGTGEISCKAAIHSRAPDPSMPAPSIGISTFWTLEWSGPFEEMSVEVGVIPAALGDTGDMASARMVYWDTKGWVEIVSVFDRAKWTVSCTLPKKALRGGQVVLSLKTDTPTLWRYLTAGRTFTGSPVITTGDDPAIVTGTRDNRILCLDLDGKPKWSRKVGGILWPSPELFASDVDGDGFLEIVVAPSDDTIRLFDLSGETIWSLDAPAVYKGIPAVGSVGNEKRIYVALADVGVWALSPNGQRLWQWSACKRLSSPAVFDLDGDGVDEVLVNVGSHRLVVLSSQGKVIGEHTLREDPCVSRVCSTPVVAEIGGDIIIFMGSEQDGLVAFNSRCEPIWKSPAGGRVTGGCVYVKGEGGDGGRIIFGASDQVVRCVDEEGELMWETALVGNIQSTPTIAHIGDPSKTVILIGSGRQGKVAVLDLAGKQLGLMPSDTIWAQTVAVAEGERAILMSADRYVRSVDLSLLTPQSVTPA